MVYACGGGGGGRGCVYFCVHMKVMCSLSSYYIGSSTFPNQPVPFTIIQVCFIPVFSAQQEMKVFFNSRTLLSFYCHLMLSSTVEERVHG